MKDICLLGATGSIGSQVLDIIASNPNHYRLVAFAYGQNTKKAIEIIEVFKPKLVACKEKTDMDKLKTIFPYLDLAYGEEGRKKVVEFESANPVIINALVGSVGLLSTVNTINYGRDVLLANKESLVMAGDIIMNLAKEKGVSIIPIDSEHVALAQILAGKELSEVKNLILTASGGSLYHKKISELKDITLEEALRHPNWSMGAKITIDSATMMNKGFEIIEAHHLFGFEVEQIKVIIHPESIVHSLVEFIDGSMIAQMAKCDMRLSINYALNYPHHQHLNIIEPLSLNNLNLHFIALDEERFPCVKYAKWALSKGGFYPAILNSANEALVDLFLKGEISFNQIDVRLGKILDNSNIIELFDMLPVTIDNIIKVDQMVKNKIYQREV